METLGLPCGRAVRFACESKHLQLSRIGERESTWVSNVTGTLEFMATRESLEASLTSNAEEVGVEVRTVHTDRSEVLVWGCDTATWPVDASPHIPDKFTTLGSESRIDIAVSFGNTLGGVGRVRIPLSTTRALLDMCVDYKIVTVELRGNLMCTLQAYKTMRNSGPSSMTIHMSATDSARPACVECR